MTAGLRSLMLPTAFVLLFGTGVPSASAAQTGRLRGTVVDARTGEPIERAAVSAVADKIERSVDVDSAGHFELCRLGNGPAMLSVRTIAFEPADTLIDLNGGATAAVRVALHPRLADSRRSILLDTRWGQTGPAPMFVVDGVRFFHSPSGCEDPPPGVPLLGSLRYLDIDTVEVVRGTRAVAAYGPDAADGVVIITTRTGASRRP